MANDVLRYLPPVAPAAGGRGSLLEVQNLSVSFTTDGQSVDAVHDVNFTVGRNEIVGLVGESGSGKSAVCLAIMGLLPKAGEVTAGSARLDGEDMLRMSARQLRRTRGNRVAMIFQDPLTALDPVFTIETQLVETIQAHERVSKSVARSRAITLLENVGIPKAAERITNYPHQFSGGMRQRVAIAMALACNPELIIADEPTTALDVTIQAQILDLLRKLNEELGTSIIFISHDLGVISELCTRVMTMYAGQVIEESGTDRMMEQPAHPYTSGLLQSVPRPTAEGRRLPSIPGRVPSLTDLPGGCRFHPRCSYAREICVSTPPDLLPHHSSLARCHLADELTLPGYAGHPRRDEHAAADHL